VNAEGTFLPRNILRASAAVLAGGKFKKKRIGFAGADTASEMATFKSCRKADTPVDRNFPRDFMNIPLIRWATIMVSTAQNFPYNMRI
jgi:hypothetical protein